MRPDISIWNDDKVIATIECKTQLGWGRFSWEEDFNKREIKLKETFPEARTFLVVMTSENWKGIPEDNKKAGNKYYVLSKIWPTKITDKNFDSIIINPIEDLFKKFI